MKNKIKTSVMLFLLGAMTFFMACKKSDDSPKIEEPIANPTLSSISPTNGSKTTPVTFNGSDFGSDASKVTVFFNDVEAEVQSVADDKIVALVPARAFSGAVKVVIDGTTLNGPLFTYTITDVQVTNFAGKDTGSFDMISIPTGMALDVDGNIYVGDVDLLTGDAKIKKITPNGEVTAFAGNAQNDPFTSPTGVALDAEGNIYVADSGNHKIFKITPSGVESLFAGGAPGFNNANGASAMFDEPRGVAVDVQGNVYVADSGNHKIRIITPSGDVTTFAGDAGGFSDGDALTVAQFFFPVGVALDAQGNMYVADSGNNRIRNTLFGDFINTLAGNTVSGTTDGPGSIAQFFLPNALALDVEGNVYVADLLNHSIRKITPNGEVITLAGSTDGIPGDTEGTGVIARFRSPYGIAVDVERNVYVSELGNSKIKKITQE